MNTEELAEAILISLYRNPQVEPEDYKHNATVAINMAHVFKLQLKRVERATEFVKETAKALKDQSKSSGW